MLNWAIVSRRVRPGRSHGKPPNSINLDNSNIVRRLTEDRVKMKIFSLCLKNFRREIGVINTNESRIPITIIINIDVIMSVLP